MASSLTHITCTLTAFILVTINLCHSADIPFCKKPGSECLNGGRCIIAGDGVDPFCLCPSTPSRREKDYPRYEGTRCEIDRDLCFPENNPCKNGRCIQSGDGFPGFCMCPGYTGKYCETKNKGWCDDPYQCMNGGSCLQPGGPESGFCLCTSQFLGERCEQARWLYPWYYKELPESGRPNNNIQ